MEGTLLGNWTNRGYLPHYDDGASPQFITYRLVDSLPAHVLEKVRELRDAGNSTYRNAVEHFLDEGRGSCLLRDPSNAEIVVDAWRFFDRHRYFLHAWVVMPNHVHLLIEPLGDWRVGALVNAWKSFSAKKISARLRQTNVESVALRATKMESASDTLALRRAGQTRIWQRDFFDTFIRNENHFQSVVHYIQQNPVRARLVSKPELWPWSSASGA